LLLQFVEKAARACKLNPAIFILRLEWSKYFNKSAKAGDNCVEFGVTPHVTGTGGELLRITRTEAHY